MCTAKNQLIIVIDICIFKCVLQKKYVLQKKISRFVLLVKCWLTYIPIVALSHSMQIANKKEAEQEDS